MAEADASRDELKAAVSARRDLGPDYEDAVLDSFLERVDRSIAARVDARVADRLGTGPDARRTARGAGGGADRSLVLGIVSLVTGVPITAIAGGQTGLGGIVVAWFGIAAVNIANAWGQRPRR